MPTTTNGTQYTLQTADLPTHGIVQWATADNNAGASNIPTVLYCHGSGGDYKQFYEATAWRGLRDWIIDNGWAWVEGAGGGPESWGNDAAQNAYVAYIQHVDTQLDIGSIVPLGRSMGGLVSYWLSTRSPIAARCAGLIANSAVTDMAVTGTFFGSKTWTAYGASTYEDFLVASSDHDPMKFDPNLWDGKNIIQLVGSADPTVPPEQHGYAIRNLWVGRPAIDLLDVREGGDHSQANGSYLQVDAMTSFLTQITGEEPAPPRDPVVYRTAGHYYLRNGDRYTMTPTTR